MATSLAVRGTGSRTTATTPGSTRVWIEDGCIHCHWCQNLVPQVFRDSPSGCVIAGEARSDGTSDENRARRLPLLPGTVDPATDAYLSFIADGCPARVIKIARD